MPYEFTPAGVELQQKVRDFMDAHIYPNESEYYRQYREGGNHSYPPILDDLKAEAKKRGLWNLFLPHLREGDPGTKLTNLDYAPISEQLGKVGFSSEVLNCNAPDTGNMEILNAYGNDRIRKEWLTPLLNGEIRSAFAMTEPAVGSSDATNISLSITRDGDEYVLNGRKWFTSGILAERAKVMIVMGKTDPDAPRHKQQSMIVVPKATSGVTVERSLTVFGNEDRGGHGQVLFDNVRVPADHLLGERRRRIRHLPGSPRPRPHPPLHADHRRRREGAGVHGEAVAAAPHLRHRSSPRRGSFRTGSRSRGSRSIWRASMCCVART